MQKSISSSHLSISSVEKLHKILSIKYGRDITTEELEESYKNLMNFAFALIELDRKKE